jgi:drug/metabolite transporter (DMT)-like permease
VGIVAAIIKRRRSDMTLAILYILVSVVAGAAGQVLLKKGMGSMGPLTLSVDQLGNILWRIGTNPYVVIGLAIYVTGTLFWLTALSRVDLSYAYPFASLSYVVMLIASWQLFNENITVLRLLGTLVVCLGVFIISRS